MAKSKLRYILLLSSIVTCFLISCTRNTIEFGTIPDNNYTNLVYTDTIGVQLATVMIDSFETNGDTNLLIGRYHDPYLGTVSARPYFQLDIPAVVPEIPATAMFDSMTFVIRPNHYYYGDTSRPQTIYIHELANTINYSYNYKLYNTSSVALKLPALGEAAIVIRPHGSDSIVIRLSDAKGAEIFSRLKQKSEDVTQSGAFLNYIRGISISTGANDTAAIFGLAGAAGNLALRVHYHITIPYPESHYIDFPSLANDFAFNQVLSDRPGTGLLAGTSGVTEITAEKTNGLSFMQPGTGLYLKTTFPSLRSLLLNTNIVKLLKAELEIRPAQLSFDRNKYLLPSQLYLVQTDDSNIPGDAILDSTGSAVQYADPVLDVIYGENNLYRFNITAGINAMINTPGSESAGFFLQHNPLQGGINVDRLVANANPQAGTVSRLLLTLMIIKK